MTTAKIEIAVAKWFDTRLNMVVPNVSWGLGLHECDLLVVTKSGYANEVEIKVNRYDLKKDQLKRHGHYSNLIHRLFFAIPVPLMEFREYIPERAGIIVVDFSNDAWGPFCRLERPAKINKLAQKLSPDQIQHLGRLAAMRIWSLKQTLVYGNGNEPCDKYCI